jgi:bifunctional non-homologous end joining protein LigD
LPANHVILDGEIVALDEKGRSSFQLLQVFKSSEQRVPLVYYAFDLLFLEGKDLGKEPLSAKRQRLAKLLEKAPENIRLSDELRGSKEDLLRVAQQFGLEATPSAPLALTVRGYMICHDQNAEESADKSRLNLTL